MLGRGRGVRHLLESPDSRVSQHSQVSYVTMNIFTPLKYGFARMFVYIILTFEAMPVVNSDGRMDRYMYLIEYL